MKRKAVIALVGLGIAISWWYPCFLAAERSITLPKGTETAKIGPGHFKFLLPDHKTIEVTGLNPGTGSFVLLRLIDGSSSRKVLWGGKQGRMVNAKKLSVQEERKAQPLQYARMDDSAYSLPLTLTVNEMNSEDLMAAFLKLNIDDPANNPESQDNLGESAAEMRCKALGGKWDPEKKRCDSAYPDLAIDYFGINSTSAIKGGNYILSLKIRNGGTAASLPTAAVFSGSPEVITIYGLTGPKPVPGLDPGQTHTLSFPPANNSLNIPVGNYSVHAVVNANQASFKESSTQNNEKTFVFGVIGQSNLEQQPKHKIPQTGKSRSTKD